MKRLFKKVVNKSKYFVPILGLAVIITSCDNYTTDDACNCLKESANEFMLQGVRIKSIEDISMPCEKILETFLDDAQGRAVITDCGNQILESLEAKELFVIDGSEPLEFPTLTFSSVQEFVDFLNQNVTNEELEYKYHNYNIVIDHAFVHTSSARLSSLCDVNLIDQIKDIYASDWQYKLIDQEASSPVDLIVSDSLKTNIFPSLDFYDHSNIIDVFQKRLLPYHSELYSLSQAISEYKLGGYGIYIPNVENSIGLVQELIMSCGWEDFVEDAANGRYIFLYDDNGFQYRNRIDSENYLQKLFGLNYALSDGKIQGLLKIYKTNTHLLITDLDLNELTLPKELSEGLSYDLDEFVKYIEHEMNQIEVDKLKHLPFDYGRDYRYE